MKALCFEQFGTSEVLEYKTLPDPVLSSGHAIVRTEAIGLNFADIYRRRGNYHLAGKPPFILGYEGAGVIEAIDFGETSGLATNFKVGDKVGFADNPFANAEKVVVDLEKLIPLPEEISCEIAAALLLQGLTAQYLTKDSHRIKAGEQVLIHASAGGVGLLLVQIAKILGAKVIGVTSTELKKQASLAAGADEVVLYQNWTEQVLNLSNGKGVDVVYDSIGSTLLESFHVTRTGGHVVFYGMAGGDPVAIDPRMLMDTSKTLTGGDLWNILISHQERVLRAQELFNYVSEGKLKVLIAKKFSLADGAKAHQFLESREAIGKILLIP